MKAEAFKALLLKAKPGQHIRYHRGLLAEAAAHFPEVRKTAAFIRSLTEIGVARIYQKREDGEMNYYVVLSERLKVRKDGQGSFQEATRLQEIA